MTITAIRAAIHFYKKHCGNPSNRDSAQIHSNLVAIAVMSGNQPGLIMIPNGSLSIGNHLPMANHHDE